MRARFKIEDRKLRWATRGLIFFFVLSIGAPFIANEKPIMCVSDKQTYWPIFKRGLFNASCNKSLMTLIPYSAGTLDGHNRNVGPFDAQDTPSLKYRHWLGTDTLGRDVLAGLLQGAFIALWIGTLSTLLALIIGFVLAFLSGFIGDHTVKLSPVNLFLAILLIIIATYLWLYQGLWTRLWIVVLGGLALYAIVRFDRGMQGKKIAIPFDLIIIRIMEIFKSIPGLFLLLFFMTVFTKPSYWNIILIIGLVRWPLITRYVRAELLKIRQEDYIEAAFGYGLSHFRVFTRHALPNILTPVIVTAAFGFGSAVLLESTLSFLGIGVPLDRVSWGSMLNEARQNFDSWWLALFPGMAIFLTILLFNYLGDVLNTRLGARV